VRIPRLAAVLFLIGLGAARAAEPARDSVNAGDTDIPVTRYAAPGKILLLWFPSEYGVLAAEHIAARHLAEKGYETWLPDLYGARFLPVVPSSAEELPADDIYQVIRAAAAQQPWRKIWLVTAGRGAKYVLEGARLWAQKEGAKKPLAGAVLLYPNLYAKQPDPGEDPAYLPIAGDTRLQLIILQGELSPWYWTLDSLQTALRGAGSRVTNRTFPGIRDRFYFRDSATAPERALGERLPEVIADAITPRSKK
jgi:hypothetical protein